MADIFLIEFAGGAIDLTKRGKGDIGELLGEGIVTQTKVLRHILLFLFSLFG